jgi:hypothetical protein
MFASVVACWSHAPYQVFGFPCGQKIRTWPRLTKNCCFDRIDSSTANRILVSVDSGSVGIIWALALGLRQPKSLCSDLNVR